MYNVFSIRDAFYTHTHNIEWCQPFSLVQWYIFSYFSPDYWDSICTVYFLDTANNIVAYIEMIYNILKPGGYWINFGN